MPQPCHQTSWQWWQRHAYCGQKCRRSRLEPIPKNEIQSEASRVGVPVWDSVPSKANATTGWCLCLPCPVQIALVLKFCPGLIEKHGGNAATPQTPRECCWKPQGIGRLQPCGSTQVPAVEGFPVSGKGTPPGGHSVLGHVVPRDFFRETQVGRRLCVEANPTQNTYKTSTERTSNANAAGNKGKTAGAAKNTPNHTPLDSYKPAGSPCARFDELGQRFPPSPAHITSFVVA